MLYGGTLSWCESFHCLQYDWSLFLHLTGYSDGSCTCCGVRGITSQKAVILTALFIYIGGYQVGFGPITWLLISEIFPLEVRGKAVSIAVVTNFFWNTVMTFLFPLELDYIGSAATFFIYAGILIVSIFFIYSAVPETKGMSLEGIEEYFIRSVKISNIAKPVYEDDSTKSFGSDSGKKLSTSTSTSISSPLI